MLKQRYKAFTIIELLVVISIIALLLAILLPGLAYCKEQARRIRCMANLKEIGAAMLFYGTKYDEALPNNLDPGHPYTAYLDNIRRPDGSLRPVKLACLFEAKLIPDPRIFYCPSAKAKYEDYCNPEPWGTLPQEINKVNQWVRTAYYYYPQSLQKDSSGFPKVATRRDYLDTTKSMVTDNVWSYNVLGHFVGSKSVLRRAICAVFGDGHAAACINSEAMAPELWFINPSLPNPATPGNFKTIRPTSWEFKKILSELKG